MTITSDYLNSTTARYKPRNLWYDWYIRFLLWKKKYTKVFGKPFDMITKTTNFRRVRCLQNKDVCLPLSDVKAYPQVKTLRHNNANYWATKGFRNCLIHVSGSWKPLSRRRQGRIDELHPSTPINPLLRSHPADTRPYPSSLPQRQHESTRRLNLRTAFIGSSHHRNKPS